MTAVFFPGKPYADLTINPKDGLDVSGLTYSPFKSIWL
jgi:hypothetical protein